MHARCRGMRRQGKRLLTLPRQLWLLPLISQRRLFRLPPILRVHAATKHVVGVLAVVSVAALLVLLEDAHV